MIDLNSLVIRADNPDDVLDDNGETLSVREIIERFDYDDDRIWGMGITFHLDDEDVTVEACDDAFENR